VDGPHSLQQAAHSQERPWGTLCDMARDLARHLAPGGTAILSGLFDRQRRV